MAEKGFGIKQLDIIGSTGTPLVESKAGLNIRLAGQGPNGIGYTVGIGTTGLATWLTTKNNADPDNVTTLNCGIITANYIYGTFDGNISGGNGLTNITVDYTGRNAPCAMPITISAPSTGTKQINIPDNSNAFGAKYVQDSEPTGTSVCDGDIWYDTSSTGGSGGGITIEDEGTALSTIATTLNFVGSGVVASGTGAEKTITISGGGGGGTPDTPLNSFQFNESSSFGGADHFKYDSTTGGVVFDDGNTPADASKTLKLYTNNRSYIDSAGTDLHLRLTSTNSSQHIKLEPGGSHTGLKVTYQGSVEAYYNNSKKIETQDEGISIYGGGSVGAGILFYEGSANGTNKINIKSPTALAADYTLTLPADDGDADEVLKTDGSGVLSWVAQSGGGGISGITIKDEGSALSTLATTLNFAGAGVVASGTGAEKTITISGGSSTFISVKDYGAVGDGATDDTTSIQNAINATSAAKQRLYIPAGTYIVSGLSLLNNTYLFGVGTLKRKASTSNYVITASGKNNCILKGFTIDGNKSAATDNKAAVFIDGGYQVVIDGITVTNHTWHGIGIRDTTDRTQKTESYIKNCTVSNSDEYGIEAQDVKDLTIIGNLISNVTSTGILIYGTAADKTDLVTVEGNTVIDAGGAGISAPYISGTSNFGAEKVQIIDNKVKSSGNNGIVVQTNNGIVSNNICDDNGTTTGHQGILINGHYITVDGNSSINNKGVGIDVGDGKFVTVTNNIVNNNAQIGIEINSCESCVVDGNIVRNNWTGSAGDISLRAGIVVHEDTSQFSGGCLDIIVSNNDVKGGSNQVYGISLLANTNRVSIIGNSITGSGSSRALNIEAINGSFICEKNIDPPSDIASATSITVDQNTNFQIVTGTTTITSIVTGTGDADKYQRGRLLTLLFTGVLQVTNGLKLKLNGNLTTSNGTTLTLVAEDGYWYEVSRKSGSGGGSSAGDISFTQTGTGAVARTVDGKLKDNINVWDFIPVGTTTASTDCASYFQAAINTGKTVHVPKGTYRIDSTLLLDGGYETLIGDESMPVLLKWTEGPAIQISEPGGSGLNEYSRVENFYIQRKVGGSFTCPNYNETLTESLAGVVVSGHGAGVAAAVQSTRISNLRVGNFAVGFYFADCVGVTVHKCFTQNLALYTNASSTANGTTITSSMWGVGFYFDATRYGAGSISPLASIEIVECDDNREGDPTLIKSVGYLVVGEDPRDIFFQRAESSHADYGWYLDGLSNDDLNWDLHIIRPIIDAFKKHGIYAANLDGVGSLSIIGGYYVGVENAEASIYAINSNGICITGGAQVLGLTNHDGAGNTDDGIRLDSCSSCSIIGNRFANLQYAISLNGTTYSTIQGNVINAAVTGEDAQDPSLVEAIRLFGNSTFNTVGNNTIRGLSGSNKYTKGINLASGSDNCKIIGNIIDSTTVTTQIDDNASGTEISGDNVTSRWTIGADGSSHYTFTGPGGLSAANDPTIYLARGQTYEFVNSSGGSHPFQIRVSDGGSAYNTGVTNNGASSGTIKFEVPFAAPNTLVYQCTSHSGMLGNIVVYPSI